VSSTRTDNLILIFSAADRPGAQGDSDVWMTTRPVAQAQWEPAVSLGEPINSFSLDFPVALSRDGLRLFIKTYRAGLVGGIYVCQRANQSARFGPPGLVRSILDIGTGGADFCGLSTDETTLYVGTYRDLYLDWPQFVQIGITALPQLKVPGRNALNHFQFDLMDREGAPYELQTSPDFRAWTPLLTTNLLVMTKHCLVARHFTATPP